MLKHSVENRVKSNKLKSIMENLILKSSFRVSVPHLIESQLFNNYLLSNFISFLFYVFSFSLANSFNYALGKPTQQSTTFALYDGDGSNAVDGDIATSSHTEREDSPFWLVDLQRTVWVTGVALTNRNNENCKYDSTMARDLLPYYRPSVTVIQWRWVHPLTPTPHRWKI